VIRVSVSRCVALFAFALALQAVPAVADDAPVAGDAPAAPAAPAASAAPDAPATSTAPAAPATSSAGACDVGPVTSFLAADATQTGVISLDFFGAQGASVEFLECVDGTLHSLGSATSASGTATVLDAATTWNCARPVRQFYARATLADGSQVAGFYSVRTGSCASRFVARVPARVAPGKVGRVRIVDSWGIGGITPLLCIAPPHGDKVCQKVSFPHAVSIKTKRFRASLDGHWNIELLVRSKLVIRRSIAVGPNAKAPPPLPAVLATGDSTMQGVDSFLADELADTATVRSDIRIGTGLSKTDWQAIAEAQVKRFEPTVTVMSVGVNEGFAMQTPAGTSVECCDAPWVAEYVRRVRKMMRSYLRHGRGRVIWLTLPLPRSGPLTSVITAVNGAIVSAGEGMERTTILRMDQTFSPGGFQDVIRYRGRYVRVRAADGIHLSVEGTAIAAKIIAHALRAAIRSPT
jgi:hypothetical protein